MVLIHRFDVFKLEMNSENLYTSTKALNIVGGFLQIKKLIKHISVTSKMNSSTASYLDFKFKFVTQ